LQSRYYNPIWGRFLNADALVSTGQGELGNNMFAYCNNNPVNLMDRNGDSPDSIFAWIGEELGELLYEWITGNDHPSHQTETVEIAVVSEQNQMIADGASEMWDAYSEYAQDQEATQRRGAEMNLQAYDYINEHENIETGMSGGIKIVTGTIKVITGTALLLAPIPTPADDLRGVQQITIGIYKVCYGIAEVVAAFVG